ncbi:MAG: tripartite tricarboxylate transporter TctB family protein [Clostridium sp.]|nr:tripartite tricarboxylate transporter TctB family protein [Clostridium sp.]MBP3216052.1 tripartite tricarboxylate transporter TctB family protein [Clostridium sp.]MBQ5421633.1 tripartite tricarboxylate transporter TctB family protein [Clostridium sp.]
MNRIRHKNDMVLGLITTAFSMFLIFGKITEQKVNTNQSGFFGRPDVWIRGLGILMLLISVILMVRAINFKKEETEDRFHFYIDSTVVGLVISLILYTVLLPKLGFIITTFAETFYLALLFTVRERGLSFRTVPGKDWGGILIKCIITAAVLLVIFWIVFGKLLAIQLPTFDLFG